MNDFTPRRDFSGQPYRAHDVITTLTRAHRAMGSALVPYTRSPPGQLRRRISEVLEAIQFLPMYLDGVLTMDVDGALKEASNAIASLDAAVAHDRSTIAGRFARWLHARRHPEEYMTFAVSPPASSKRAGSVIPSLLGWKGPVQIHDPKADPKTLH